MCDYRQCDDGHNLQAMSISADALRLYSFVHRVCLEARWVDREYASLSSRAVRDGLLNQQLRLLGGTSVEE